MGGRRLSTAMMTTTTAATATVTAMTTAKVTGTAKAMVVALAVTNKQSTKWGAVSSAGGRLR